MICVHCFSLHILYTQILIHSQILAHWETVNLHVQNTVCAHLHIIHWIVFNVAVCFIFGFFVIKKKIDQRLRFCKRPLRSVRIETNIELSTFRNCLHSRRITMELNRSFSYWIRGCTRLMQTDVTFLHLQSLNVHMPGALPWCMCLAF